MDEALKAELDSDCACGSGKKAGACCRSGESCACDSGKPAGCDAVYFGVGYLNMRAKSAANFDLQDLEEVKSICKKNKIKCYLAINTLLYDHDIQVMKKLIDAVKEHNVDGIIASDIAVITYAREQGVEVHISTQLSISNYEAVKYWAQYADRVVLARELNLKMVKEIHDRIIEEQLRGPKGNLIEIELFAHGALCIAQSGRCTMSLYQYNASANRGACKQVCRKAYKVRDVESNKELIIENEYVMSPKDICTINFLDQVLEAGVVVLKIEGRGRPADYVERVVRCYREALGSLKEGNYTEKKIKAWMKKLGTVFNRGMSDGYYLGKSLGEWSAVYGSKATEERHYVGRIMKYFPKAKIAEILNEALEVEKGDKFVITGPSTGVVRGTFEELRTDEEGFINHVQKKRMVTFPLAKRVRKNDKLYILKKRTKHQVPLPYRSQ